MTKIVSSTEPIVKQIINEAIDRKFEEIKDEVRQIVREEFRKEADRQYELMRMFMKSMGVEIDELDRRVRVLERAATA